MQNENLEEFLATLSSIHAYDNESAFTQFLGCLSNYLPVQYATIWQYNPVADTVSVMERTDHQVDENLKVEFVHDVKNSLISKILDDIEDGENVPFLHYPSVLDSKIQHLHLSKERARRLQLTDLIAIPFHNYHKEEDFFYTYGVINIYTDEYRVFNASISKIIGEKLSELMSAYYVIKRKRITDKILRIFEEQIPNGTSAKELVCQIISEVCVPLIRVEACSIWEWDAYSNSYFKIGESQPLGLQQTFGKPINDVLGRGLTGQVAKLNKPLIIKNLQAAEEVKKSGIRSNSFQELWEGGETTAHTPQSFLAVPVKNPAGKQTDKPIAVMRFVNKISRKGTFIDYFDEDDVEFVNEIARLLALHEEQARLEMGRSAFALQFGHEAKAPAVGIRGTSQRLQRLVMETPVNTKPVIRMLQDIESFADLIMSFSDTLTFGLGDPNQPKHSKYNPRQHDLRKIIDSSKKVVIPLCRGENIHFDNISIVGSYPSLHIDSKAWTQVFYNLFTNAIKYRNKNDGNEFRVIVKSAGTSVVGYQRSELPIVDKTDLQKSPSLIQLECDVIEVSDYGIGIPPEYADEIFEEGFRAPGVSAFEVRGSGIGLPIVKRILADFHCKIHVASFGGPTTFQIFVPTILQSRQYLSTSDWKPLSNTSK
ncbi:GAF domain-containing sensor histidine kinase [Thalassospira povalilytica]|uniref:GAF domain-containing sensor histidine kinase n=1 Tax=Thalassospira povalilytica TaxID=732237 RepID=UPI001D195F96|nr:GAF domain-containing sensor histidine kinase [Thalassospira povalilytica]MCC4242755.1 GAF domain-containing sensor histidine kinase [Thalassospira povalilytica]